MQAKEVIGDIKRNVLAVKQQGHQTLSIDAFLQYLDQYQQDIEGLDEYDRYKHESSLAQFDAENERNLQNWLEQFRSVITLGQMSIRSAMVINGGAAIAVLAFIGNLWSKGLPQDSLQPLASAIAAFPSGALAAAAAAGITYFCQYCYAMKWQKLAVPFHILSILMVLASLGLFGVGVWNCYEAFSVRLSNNAPVSAAPQVPARAPEAGVRAY